MLEIAWKNVKCKAMCLCFASLSHFTLFSRSFSVSSFFSESHELVSVDMRSNVMDDLMKVMSWLVAFLRFCCSLNEMANVTDGHAWFSMNWAWWQACQQKRRRDPQVWLFHCQESWLCAVVTTVHMRSIAMKTSRMLFLALSRWRVFAEDIGNGLNKMKIRWCMLDVCLTILDIGLTILTFTLCVWKACRRLKQNNKDCQAFFFHNDVAFFSFWRSLLSLCPFVKLPLIECTKPCFEWIYQQDQRL